MTEQPDGQVHCRWPQEVPRSKEDQVERDRGGRGGCSTREQMGCADSETTVKETLGCVGSSRKKHPSPPPVEFLSRRGFFFFLFFSLPLCFALPVPSSEYNKWACEPRAQGREAFQSQSPSGVEQRCWGPANAMKDEVFWVGGESLYDLTLAKLLNGPSPWGYSSQQAFVVVSADAIRPK